MIDTSRFETLYRRIDASLEDHLRKETGTSRLSTGDEAWFRALMVSFRAEFDGWPSLGPGDVHDYLRLFESRGVDPLLRLAAHAFLHIGYDLPRVIAKSLPPGLNRASRRTVFLRPGPIFLAAFLKHATSGGMGVLGRLVGSIGAARILAFWVIALRSTAWIHAEILADSGTGLEARMAMEMFRAGREAKSGRWILGIPDLDNSQLFQVAPVAASPFPLALAAGLGAVVGAILTVLLIVWAIVHRDRRMSTAAQIDVFGALVYRGLVRAMNPEIELEPLPKPDPDSE